MLAVLAVVFVQWIPILGAVKGALSSYAEIGRPSLLPEAWRWQNFVDIWQAVPLAGYLWNTLFYSITSTVLTVVASLPAAYALSRFEFRGRSLFLFLILATQMVAVSTIIVPLFRMVISADLFDSRLTIVVISSAMAVPLAVWLLRSYFENIPYALEEAAMLDGCSRLQTLWLIVLPQARPGVAAASVMSFVLAYKQFFVPLVLLSSETKYPALVGIYTLASQRLVPWHLVMAGILIIMLPAVIVFFLAQKELIGGLSAGGLK